MNLRFPLFFLCLTLLPAWAARPVIAHEAPESVPAGQPLRLIARVSSPEALRSVSIHITRSGSTAPVTLPMRSTGAGIYTVTLDPPLFSGSTSFRYYLDAHTVSGEWTETNWFTVQVVGGGTQETASGRRSWRRPALIAAGTAAAVGIGVAVADSGGGSGGGEEPPPIDPADQLVVRTLSDNVNAPFVNLPVEQSVNIDGELAGRTIRRVRIRLEFDPVDLGAETFAVVYNGRVVISGTAEEVAQTQQVDVAGGGGSTVTVRVLNSVKDDETFTWRWNATVTYFLGN